MNFLKNCAAPEISCRPTQAPVADVHRAFTLVELLVVIAIIGVLASLVLPIYGTISKNADKVTCLAHLKQILAASNLAANDNNGNYPHMRGYTWETNAGTTPAVWIADALAPYIGGTAGMDPTKLLRCPAAQKNAQETWLQGTQYCHYRFNYYIDYFPAQSTGGSIRLNNKPLVGYANAMLFFDTMYLDWIPSQWAHFPGKGDARMDAAYADGHVATLTYADFKNLNQTTNEQTNDFFTLGWIK